MNLHLDEARERALEILGRLLRENGTSGTKAVLIDDLYGRLRVILWGGGKRAGQNLRDEISRQLEAECGQYWSGEIWLATGEKTSRADKALYDRAWDEGVQPPDFQERLRVLDRHRNRGAWFTQPGVPTWKAARDKLELQKKPPVIVFYSFKGGLGRTTSLASFAIQRARSGERVVVIDADLAAPGVGSLLSAEEGQTARWGTVDYLLERSLGNVELRDFYHPCRKQSLTGSGEILVIPAGRIDSAYLGKLARVDLEPNPDTGGPHPMALLLEDIRKELQPHWILFDARAGLADPAGMLLSGMAHLHVIFGTFSGQSWSGLRLVLERLGKDRIHARQARSQADCLVVQAMIPANTTVAEYMKNEFLERSRDELTDLYYQADPEPGKNREDVWYVSDAGSSDAPHVPIPISYEARLADYRSIDDIADFLVEASEFRHLASRITARFGVD